MSHSNNGRHFGRNFSLHFGLSRALAVVVFALSISGCAGSGIAPGGPPDACSGPDCTGQGGDAGGGGCKTDTDCAGKPNKHCNALSHTCVACATNDDCGPASLCDTSSGRCTMGCSQAKGCGDAGQCEVDAGMCVACLADTDCTDKAAPVCDRGNGCVACLPAKDNCGHALFCNMKDGKYQCLAGCKKDDDCKDPPPAPASLTPFCDMTQHSCVQCQMDNDCPGGQLCAGGSCVNGCSPTRPCVNAKSCCGAMCADLTSDSNNCGACGTTCQGGWNCCASSCQNPVNSVNNCGACGNVCTVANGVPACVGRQCQVSKCTTGFADCNNSYMDGCEVDTTTNILNCGGCSKPCNLPNAQPNCVNGSCTILNCTNGFGDCDMLPANGCEKNIHASDNNNCGACGMVCSPAHGAGACNLGVCAISACDAGWGDCNGMAADGCETDLSSTASHCGSCMMSCTIAGAMAACVNSQCAVGGCLPGFADCNRSPIDGCEVGTITDPNNCGSCAHVCSVANGTSGCALGACTVTSCSAGFADCNNLPGDGCETNKTTNVNNCGACGNVCPGMNAPNADSGCANSSCTLSCRGEYYDVNGLAADGCEQLHGQSTGHDQASAHSLGSQGCADGTRTTFTGTILSDTRAHTNPTINSFNASVGSAPDYWSTVGTGSGFCVNTINATITTNGGGGSTCYKLTFTSDRATYSTAVSGSGSATINVSPITGGQYNNNATIYFTVEKTCTTAVTEAVNYSVTFNL